MKSIFTVFALIGFLGSFASEVFAADSKYIVVGVSGFRTGRPQNKVMDIRSDELCPNCDPNGAWSNLPDNHSKIYQRAFLSHYSTQKEIDAVIKLFQGNNKTCAKGLGMIIMANSWGASVANSLAKRFQTVCKKQVEFFAMIDGIQKPLTLAYRTPLAAKSCLNIYQTVDVVHGAKISNCKNIDLLQGMSAGKGIGTSHIYTEWNGTQYAASVIESLLD